MACRPRYILIIDCSNRNEIVDFGINCAGNKNAVHIIEWLLDNDYNYLIHSSPLTARRSFLKNLVSNKNSNVAHIIENKLSPELIFKLNADLEIQKKMFENENIIELIMKMLNTLERSHYYVDRLCDFAKNPGSIAFFEKLIDNDIKKAKKNRMYIQKKLLWDKLFENPNAIHIIEKYIEEFSNLFDIATFNGLASNPNAIHLLEKNKDKFHLFNILSNPNAIHLIEEYMIETKFYDKNSPRYYSNSMLCPCSELAQNPNAIHIIEKIFNNLHDTNCIEWCKGLTLNPNAGLFVENFIDNNGINRFKKCTYELSKSQYMINVIEKYPELINWSGLCENPKAIHILERNMDKLCHNSLCKNPNAVHLFAPLDHKYMFETNKKFKKELTEKVFNPLRLERLCNILGIELSDYIEIYIE